jgi:GT2 family glycosyltransferase
VLTNPDETAMWRGHRVPEAPVVSVCILVVSDHGLIEGCIDSLMGSRPSAETEVVVVANGIDGDQFTSLRERDDIVLVKSPVNLGFAGGNNLAARFARGRYLLLLNDDSVVEAGFIDRLLSAFERDRLLGAVGGTILWPDGTLQEAGSVLWSDGWAAHVGAGFPVESTAYHYVRYVDYTSANGLLVDRQAWDAVGGLDERYFPAYFEDADLCLALWDHGYRVAYEPRARLTHLESQSTSPLFREFLMIRNRSLFVAKWSTLLESYADHPDPIDNAAMDTAVYRAERSLGRMLVVESSAIATEWQSLVTIEALAIAGWSVTVSVPAREQGKPSADEAIRDRLVDLGVDVREDPPEDLIFRYGDDLEAVLSGEGADGLSLRRPDGSLIALVRKGEELEDSVTARIASVVHGEVEFSASVDSHDAAGAVAVPDPSNGAMDHRGDVAEGVAESPLAATAGDAAGRDLTFVEADANIRREYCQFLETELAGTRDALAQTQAALEQTKADLRGTTQVLEDTRAYLEDTRAYLEQTTAFLEASLAEKERYIDSLPSVRAKKWIVGRLPKG